MKVSDPEIKKLSVNNNDDGRVTCVKHYLTPYYIIHITKFLYMKDVLFHIIYIYKV